MSGRLQVVPGLSANGGMLYGGPVPNVGNAFSLPFKDPNWFTTFLVIGLCSLIPIIGSINLDGWMLATLDNYRQGRPELAPAGLQYLGRGMNLFLVQLLYGVVIAVIFIVPFFLLGGLAAATSGSSSNGTSAAGSAVFGAGILIWDLGIFVFSFFYYAFFPAIVIQTERGGIGGGLNIGAVYRMVSAGWGKAILSALLIYVASMLGGLGIIACCVGIIVTFPYTYAVMAGVIRYYEASFETGAPPSFTPPPPAIA